MVRIAVGVTGGKKRFPMYPFRMNAEVVLMAQAGINLSCSFSDSRCNNNNKELVLMTSDSNMDLVGLEGISSRTVGFHAH